MPDTVDKISLLNAIPVRSEQVKLNGKVSTLCSPFLGLRRNGCVVSGCLKGCRRIYM